MLSEELTATKKFYVICTTPRSGSNLLCDLLSSSGVMGQPKEFLNLDSMIIPFAKRHQLIEEESKIDIDNYFNYTIQKFSSNNDVFGMKILFDQYKELRQFRIVKELLKKCQFIWLLRRDVVAQAVSLYIARETNEWTSLNQEFNYQKEQFNRRELVQYNEEQIAKFLNKIEKDNLKWLEFFAINEIEYLQMYYEDILIDPNICRDICKLCKVESEYNFSLEKTSFQKQGDILNEKLSTMFRENSIMNLDRKNKIIEINLKNFKLCSQL